MVEAGYTAVYDKDEVNFYDKTAKIQISEEAVLKGYRCPVSGLWRVALREQIEDEKVDTLILDSPCGTQSLNTLYEVPRTDKIRVWLKMIRESINNVYELPSTEQTIRYLHAAAGFPTKSTWLKAIRNGNYLTWPMINVKNVGKHFPESEETQQGHMRNQRQGVRSIKIKIKVEDEKQDQDKTLPKKHDIYIQVHNAKETVYTDQTGRLFPHVSSRGNKYQMILYHVDSNSIWVEPMKNRTEGEIIVSREHELERMREAGITPNHQILDNEAS
jgi:hypothetical protein